MWSTGCNLLLDNAPFRSRYVSEYGGHSVNYSFGEEEHPVSR
jgi:hypothetical protein